MKKLIVLLVITLSIKLSAQFTSGTDIFEVEHNFQTIGDSILIVCELRTYNLYSKKQIHSISEYSKKYPDSLFQLWVVSSESEELIRQWVTNDSAFMVNQEKNNFFYFADKPSAISGATIYPSIMIYYDTAKTANKIGPYQGYADITRLDSLFAIAYDLIAENIEENNQDSTQTAKISIKTNNQKPLTIFPNPVTKTAFIKSHFPIQTISLYNINGKLLYKSNSGQNYINMLPYPNGIYFLKVNQQPKYIKFTYLE